MSYQKLDVNFFDHPLYKKGDKFYIFESSEVPADSIPDVIEMLSNIYKMDPTAFLSYEYEKYSYDPSEKLFVNYYKEIPPTNLKIRNMIRKKII